MRLRKVQGAKDLISDYPGYISDNQDNSNVIVCLAFSFTPFSTDCFFT